jgi:hypothetical protein
MLKINLKNGFKAIEKENVLNTSKEFKRNN